MSETGDDEKIKKSEIYFNENLDSLLESYMYQNDTLFATSLDDLLCSILPQDKSISSLDNITNRLKSIKSSYQKAPYSPSSATQSSRSKKLKPTPAREAWITQKKIRGNSSVPKKTYPEETNLQLPINIVQKTQELEHQFRHRKEIHLHGLKVVNRLLLVGDPGGGKTTLAFKIAEEMELPITTYNISSIITSSLGGTGKQIHELFSSITSGVLFLDEFDAISASRSQDNDLGEMRRVVNVLLQELDNLDEEVFLIAATNVPKKIDSAILRRFPSIIELPKPTVSEREYFIHNFLKLHQTTEEHRNIVITSKLTDGFSYAELTSLLTGFIIDTISKKQCNTLIDFYFSELQLRQELNDKLFAKWVKEKSITITALSEILSIPRTTLSDRIRKVKS